MLQTDFGTHASTIASSEHISFFVPVVYDDQAQTISQRILEAVDEYFYLGNQGFSSHQFCVKIFTPPQGKVQAWTVKEPQDCQRSWINIATKVASYSTIIIPLIALLVKVILRCALSVSSIHQADAMQVLEADLIQKAQTHIQLTQRSVLFNNHPSITIYTACIDPKVWFGFLQETPTVSMPEHLLKVLWSRIQTLHRLVPGQQPFEVDMSPKDGFELPVNFTLPLAQRITDAEIFLKHENTVKMEHLQNPQYARSFFAGWTEMHPHY